MKHEDIKRADNEDTTTAGERTDQPRDSRETGDESEHAPVLDKEAETGGVSSSEEDETREETATTGRRVARFAFKATVPTMQYGNIQPEIELHNVTIKEGEAMVMPYLKQLFNSYAENGGLKERSVTTKAKSFNEENVEIEYDALNHAYYYNGVKLTGVTDYVKTFYKDFDVNSIAPACAKAWDCTEDDVRAIWKSNGGLTSDFGSLIHQMIENYDTHKVVGEKIAEIKKLDENYVLPKHPVLKKILLDFLEVSKTDGEIVPEVIITDVTKGYCGRADRLTVTGEKECYIEDYKVNIDSEKEDKNSKIIKDPFKDLPASKLSKYQLQLSIYANMLENSGWTVKGLRVYVFEDQWKLHELPVLKVI